MTSQLGNMIKDALQGKAPQKPVYKPKKRAGGAAPTSRRLVPDTSNALSLPKYLSVTLVQTTLLFFVLLALPRTKLPISLSTPRTKTSLDRPEWAWVASLTQDPLATVGWVALGAGIVAFWWAGELGSLWQGEEARKQKLKGGSAKTNEVEEKVVRKINESSRKWKAMKLAIISTLVASVFVHVLIHLLGAPLRISPQLQIETYLLSLLLSILTVYTPIYVLGMPTFWDAKGGLERWVWTRLFIDVDLQNPLERAVVYPVLLTLLGAWLGAFPIALDWDRPWQAWPLTPTVGAILGCIAGNFWSAGRAMWDEVLEAGGANSKKTI